MVIEDDGYTGAVLERPGLEQVSDLAAEGRIDTVLVHSPDRLSRRYAYQILIIEELARQGVEIVFLNAPSGAVLRADAGAGAGFVDYSYMQFSFVADRFQYLAGIGVLAVCWGGGARDGQVSGGERVRSGAGAATEMRAATGMRSTARQHDRCTPRPALSHDQAAAVLAQIRDLDPEDPETLHAIAESFRAGGRLDQAMANYHAAIRADREFAPAHAGLGLTLSQAQRYAAATPGVHHGRRIATPVLDDRGDERRDPQSGRSCRGRRTNASGTGYLCRSPMPDLPPATPHDALFRALLADPGRAETLIREYLPPAVAAELSDAPIRLVDASFVDAVLHQSHSDRLFEARLRDGGIAFVYVLLEHKAAPDPGTPLQMLGYMVRIWQRYAEDRASRLRALPPIVPLIFYHGRQRWSEALSVAEMIAGEGELAAFARRLCCVLHDLGQRPLAALSGHPAVWSGLAALVVALRGQPEEGVLRRILSGVPDESELELQVLSYIVRTYELSPAVLETAARVAKPQRWEALMSTVAEAWMREGKAEGRAQGKAEGRAMGRAEGKAETLLRLLQRRFGPVAESARARVADGSAAEIDAWFDALFDAQSLTEVFDARSQ